MLKKIERKTVYFQYTERSNRWIITIEQKDYQSNSAEAEFEIWLQNGSYGISTFCYGFIGKRRDKFNLDNDYTVGEIIDGFMSQIEPYIKFYEENYMLEIDY